jgi:hypothetical protein
MTILRRVLAPVACLISVVFLVASVQTAASARTVDERCAGRGPIPAAALAHGVSGLGCSLVGRVVYAGRVSVMVPPAGISVAGDGIGRYGDVIGLRVVNTGSEVRAVVGAAARSGGAGAGASQGRVRTARSTSRGTAG